LEGYVSPGSPLLGSLGKPFSGEDYRADVTEYGTLHLLDYPRNCFWIVTWVEIRDFALKCSPLGHAEFSTVG
jgi:hypothetical protein